MTSAWWMSWRALAIWYSDEMNQTPCAPRATFSLTAACCCGMRSSLGSDCSQVASAISFANVLYSASKQFMRRVEHNFNLRLMFK